MANMSGSKRVARLAVIVPAAALMLAGCGGAGNEAAGAESSNTFNAAEGDPIVFNEAEGAALADEAAAAEAADTSLYGGNAAAGEAGTGAAASNGS